MKILHLADVHLDRPFVGLDKQDAADRRRELRDAFDRCLALARERSVDLITIGGDLWEDEHVTPDTLRWVAARLKGLAIPCVLVSGNHDPLYEGGPYQRAGLPATTTILAGEGSLDELKLVDVSIWGASWRRSEPLRADFLHDFRVPEDGRHHLLLLHGTAGLYPARQGHCPFTTEQVRAAGFDLCLAGHVHAGDVINEHVIYPGSPEPLDWSETGTHAVALIDTDEATVATELVAVNARRYEHIDVDCTGADSSAEVEARVGGRIEELDNDGLCLRLNLVGRISPDCRVDRAAIRDLVIRLGATLAQVNDRTAPDFDFEEICAGTGLQAHFVRRMLDLRRTDHDNPVIEEALHLGLLALQGKLP